MNCHTAMNEVKAVIQAYIDGTYEADVEKLKSVFAKNAVMNGYLGPDCVLATPSVFVDDIASAPSMKSAGDAYDAQIESIHIEGDIASVVVSETGFRGSATLVDIFQLVKIDGAWKIVSKLFTTK